MEKKKLKKQKIKLQKCNTKHKKPRPKVRNLTLGKGRGNILKWTALSLMNNTGDQLIKKCDYT